MTGPSARGTGSRRIEMEGKPNCWWILTCPLYAMADAGGNTDSVIRPKGAWGRLAFNLKLRLAGQQQYPFVPILEQPFTRWRRLASRDNPLQVNSAGLEKWLEHFIRSGVREIRQDVASGDRHGHWAVIHFNTE